MNSSSKNDSNTPLKTVRISFLYIIVGLLVLWIWQGALASFSTTTISYSEFKNQLRQGNIIQLSVAEEEIHGVMKAEKTGKEGASSAKGSLFRTVRIEDPTLISELENAKVEFLGEKPGFLAHLLWAWVFPLAFIWFFWSIIAMRMGTAARGVLDFGRSHAALVEEGSINVSFKDVAGCEEAKFELQEVVDFLSNPERYRALGAKIPKGVLLLGLPGTGKTLLARAVAGEAKVPFFSISGSDFVEMFVGVGAARVRELFAQAKMRAPCIVFIDEIDAIGRRRGIHVGAVNDEREQTLNQLLVELDGFEPNSGVIVLAATNRPDVLDTALLRPGRFDRQVILNAPDLEGREAIIRIHCKGMPLGVDVKLPEIARETPGFSGADLANVVNEAALLAARRRNSTISQSDLESAIEKVVAGPERKSRKLNQNERRRVAYHEVGHALIGYYSEGADPVRKISIVPRGRAALGFTMQVPIEERFLSAKRELMTQLRCILGGRAAEDVVFGEVTTGGENDLERATLLAQHMICLYGMSNSVGIVHWGAKEHPLYLGRGIGQSEGLLHRDCSERTSEAIDREIQEITDAAFREAKEILVAHRQELDLVAQHLLEKETLDGAEFESLLKGFGAKRVPAAECVH